MADESSAVTDTGTDIGDVSLDAFNDVEETEDTDTSPVEASTETTESTDEEQEQTPEETDSTDDTEESNTSEDSEEVDLKSMSRKERAEYYRNQQREEQQQREQIEQAVKAAYQPQDVNQLAAHYRNNGIVDDATGEVYFPTAAEATMLARQDVAEQKTQIAEAITQITQLNANIQVDAFEARQTYDWMNPDKAGKGYSETAAKAAAQLYEHMIATNERTQQIVDAKMTPKQLAQIVETIRQDAIKEVTAKARKDAEAEMASVAPSTSARQPVKQGNSLKDMEDRLSNVKF